MNTKLRSGNYGRISLVNESFNVHGDNRGKIRYFSEQPGGDTHILYLYKNGMRENVEEECRSHSESHVAL